MVGGVWVSKKAEIRYETVKDFINGKISRKHTASSLGITERAVTNLANKVRRLGLPGAIHGNHDRAPKHKKPTVMKAKAARLKEEKYFDYNISHTMDKFEQNETDLAMSYSTFYRWCTSLGLGKHKQKRRKKVTKKLRVRYKQEGFLVQMGGSPHIWFADQESCLIIMIDDATIKIVAAQFWPTETTMGCLSVLKECVSNHGIPGFIYTDGAGIYGGQKRQGFSHFDASCGELGSKVIYASSPEAKGRVERCKRTLQDRLIPELRSAGITKMGEANAFLKNFLKTDWEKYFVVEAAEADSAFKPLPIHKSLKQICSVKHEREIKKNCTISFEGVIYSLSSMPNEPKISSNSAQIRLYPDGSWAVFVENRLVSLTVAPKSNQPDSRYMQKVRRGNANLLIHGRQEPLLKTG